MIWKLSAVDRSRRMNNGESKAQHSFMFALHSSSSITSARHATVAISTRHMFHKKRGLHPMSLPTAPRAACLRPFASNVTAGTTCRKTKLVEPSPSLCSILRSTAAPLLHTLKVSLTSLTGASSSGRGGGGAVKQRGRVPAGGGAPADDGHEPADCVSSLVTKEPTVSWRSTRYLFLDT